MTSKNALSCLALATAEEVNELFIKELLHYSLALIKKADPREKSICVITGELKNPTVRVTKSFAKFVHLISLKPLLCMENYVSDHSYQ